MSKDQMNTGIIEPQVKTYWIAVLIGVPLFILTVLLWWFLHYQNHLDRHKRVEVEAHKLSTYIKTDLTNRIRALNRIALRWETHKGTPRMEFTKDTQNYISDMPGFQAVEWVDKSYHVRWIVPLAGNEQAQDLDLGFEKNRRIALKKAKANKAPTFSAPLDLVQGGKGFLIYFPLSAEGEFDGFLIAVFRITEWLDYVFNTHKGSEEFNSFRIRVTIDNTPVYKEDGWEDYKALDLDAVESLSIRGRRFNIYCRPTAYFIDNSISRLPEFALAIGFLMSVFISYSVFLFLKASNETWKTNIIKRDLEKEIQERKQIEDSLHETSARLGLATRAGKVGIWSWDISTNQLVWDDQMCALYDVPPDAKPNFETWQNALHPDYREKAIALVKDAVEGKAVFDTQFCILTGDGNVRHIHAAGRVERNNAGNPKRMIGVNWDISHLKLTEEALQHQTELQQILMDISSKYINIPLDKVDSEIDRALSETGQYVNADRVYIFDYNFEKKTTSNLYEWCNKGIDPQIADLQNLPLEGAEDQIKAHQQGLPMLVPDISALPEGTFKEILAHQNIKTLITVPMQNGEDLMGFVGFDWVTARYDYSEREITLLNLFSQILVNILLKTQADKMLMESRKRLDLALQGTNAGIWDWYVQTGETVFNERWAEITGYRLEELEPTSIETWMNLCHPDDLAESNELLKRHFEGELDFYECEARMKHKNGEWIWILDRGKVVSWDNDRKPLRMTGTHINVTERKNAEEKIRHMANHDGLTNLPTLRLAKDRAHIAIQKSMRNKTLSAFMFVDLDGFKNVNDTFGHESGDYLLKEIATRYTACVRKSDTVARIGGDEFLVIINEIRITDDVAHIAEKLIQATSRPFIQNDKQMNVGASIGISIYPNDGDNIDELVKKADSAMYRIKKSGKNGYTFAASEKVDPIE
ncbi:MAG: diguanylate cyclase [Desulfobacteraceae bacterium]|nr:diguanylate cyclase [Desulfobacteraceae bacterium]